MTERTRTRKGLAIGGLAAGSALVGAILAGTLSAGAATTSTATPTASPSTAAGGPGVQENDGVPESQEHHGGALDLGGTVTAVGTSTVTLETSAGVVSTYQVTSSSDIDKNGEAQLSSLKVGDVVTYSIVSGSTTIDKLHAGTESLDRPSDATASPAA